MAYLIQPKGFKGSIDYCPPVNMRPEWEHLFRPDHAYKQVKLGARLLRNVFVNHYGLVINNGLLVPGCAPNIGFSSYDDGFYLPHWKKAMEQMLVSRFGKSIESRRLDDARTYLVIHSPWFSYYFWVTECIPRLLMVREHLHELVLIYPEQWDRFAFVQETLALFPELIVERVKRDVHLCVSNLVMPEVKPWTPMFIPAQVQAVRNLILNAADSKGVAPVATGNIHLSRTDAKYKNYSDRLGVNKLLSDFGFTHLEMTGLSIFQQAKTINSADRLVSITGAGMSNFTFMKEGGEVLDLSNEKYIDYKKYKFHFWKLACIAGARYRLMMCPHSNDPSVEFYFLQNLEPDLTVLRAELQEMHTSKIRL